MCRLRCFTGGGAEWVGFTRGGAEWVGHGALQEEVLNVSAMVLANLCVSYIMTSQNEKAEDLLRQVRHGYLACRPACPPASVGDLACASHQLLEAASNSLRGPVTCE